jgi:signal transduction histidine kinase
MDRVDAVLVVLASGEAVALSLSSNSNRFVAAALAASASLVLLLRRRHLLGASLLSLALLACSLAAAPHSPNAQFFGLMVTFAIVGLINRGRDAVVASASGVALLAVATLTSVSNTTAALGDFALTAGFCTVMAVAGWLVGHRTRRADLIALQLQTERQARALALRDQRAAIARELHDVVSHGLSVVVLQAMAARAELSGHNDMAAEAHLDTVETAARDALGEMRRMLGLLQIDDFEPHAPAAGLRDIPALITHARRAGLVVDATLNLSSAGMPAGLEVAVYRIVQEALTNVVKHAPGARVQLLVAVQPDAIAVEVRDNGGGHAAVEMDAGGYGLVGMRERTELYGGELRVEQTSSGFTVVATIPVQTDPRPVRSS